MPCQGAILGYWRFVRGALVVRLECNSSRVDVKQIGGNQRVLILVFERFIHDEGTGDLDRSSNGGQFVYADPIETDCPEPQSPDAPIYICLSLLRAWEAPLGKSGPTKLTILLTEYCPPLNIHRRSSEVAPVYVGETNRNIFSEIKFVIHFGGSRIGKRRRVSIH